MGYTMDYIRGMGIFELMDDVSRLSIIINADAALTGSWSGMVDTKKIDKKIFDWMRNTEDDAKDQGKAIADGVVR